MGNRVRFQPYISVELRRRVEAYAAAQGVTESAIAEAALGEYLERDRTEPGLVVRRLDRVGEVLARVEEKLEIVGETVGRQVRQAFSVTPPTISAKARAEAADLYRQFIGTISQAVGTGATFLGAVRRARLSPAVPPSGSIGNGGQ
jgi:hypothetical protein